MKKKLLPLLFALMTLCAAAQNTIQVTNLNDSGPGSLRDAIATSANGDVIDMRGVEGTILLESVLTIPISKSIQLIGPGKDKLKISGQDATRIFTITTFNNRKVSITDVTLQNGRFDEFGGCLYVSGGGTLNLKRVDFKDCACFRASGDYAMGGAVTATTDSINIESCQFSGNSANNSIGRAVGGALHAQVTYLSVASTTFHNNTISSRSDGVAAVSIGPRVSGSNSNFQINNSTFSNNTGPITIEVANQRVSAPSTVTGVVKNSTFAFNNASLQILSTGISQTELLVGGVSVGNCLFNANSKCGPSASSLVTLLGGNLFDCPDIAGPSDFFSENIAVEPLADNGGPTLTHALKEGSIAVNSGLDTNPPPFDQRGEPRIQNGQIDIGSFESAFFNFSADFSFEAACNGSFQFQNSSKDPNKEIVEYLWDFGDGATSTAENPQHQYTPGVNSVVKLIVKSSGGQTSTMQKTITAEGLPPVINIIGDNPLTLYVNQPYVDAGATAIDLTDGDLTAHIVKTSNVVHTIPGTYSIIYSVSDVCGFASSATRTIEVISIPTPSVKLGPDKTICQGQSILLDAGPGFSGYQWSSGETTPTIMVFQSGLYSVRVVNQFGLSAKDSIAITVVPLPEPIITAAPVPCENAILLSVAAFDSYQWSSGSTTQTIKVSQSGNYSLKVTNRGCDGTHKINVKIEPGTACQQPTIRPPVVAAVCSDAPNLIRRWKITNPNSASLRIDWEIVGSIERSWMDIPTGDSYLTTITIPLNANALKVYFHDEKGQKKVLQQSSITTKCQKSTASSGRVGDDTEETIIDGKQLKAYPNPGKDHITVEITSSQETEASLEIISLSGVIQNQRPIRLSVGSNFIVQDVSNLSQGSYVIRAGSHSVRFVKE